jgi:cell division protein FtsZ
VLSTAGLNGQADPIPANDPIQVAMEAPAQAPKRRITFEELVSEDDIDVPDFMK